MGKWDITLYKGRKSVLPFLIKLRNESALVAIEKSLLLDAKLPWTGEGIHGNNHTVQGHNRTSLWW